MLHFHHDIEREDFSDFIHRYQENTLLMLHISGQKYHAVIQEVQNEWTILDGAALSVIYRLKINQDLLYETLNHKYLSIAMDICLYMTR